MFGSSIQKDTSQEGISLLNSSSTSNGSHNPSQKEVSGKISGIQEMLKKKLEELELSQSHIPSTSTPPTHPATVMNCPRNSSKKNQRPRSLPRWQGKRTTKEETGQKTTKLVESLLSPRSRERTGEGNTPLTPLNSMILKARWEKPSLDQRSMTLEMRNLANSTAKQGHGCVVLNPLKSESTNLTKENLTDYLPSLSALSDKSEKFCAETAIQEIMKCVQFHNGFHLIVECLVEIKEQLHDVKQLHERWNVFFAALFLHPQSAPLLQAYLEQSKEEYHDFADRVIDCIWKREEEIDKVMNALFIYTCQDLKAQETNNLFREKSLSSSCCRAYGCHLLAKQLEQLKDIVREEFESAKKRLLKATPEHMLLRQNEGVNYHLCVDVKFLRKEMRKRGKDFATFPENNQRDSTDRQLEENAPFFQTFASGILNRLYDLPLPNDFCTLLHMRRKAIEEEFLKKSHSVETSKEAEVFVGELLCLRILNPFLTSLELTDLQRNVMVSLSRILQNLSNGEFCEEKNSGPLLPFFKEIYENFIEQHRAFVNKHSRKGD